MSSLRGRAPEASLKGVVSNREQREIMKWMVEEGDPTNKLAG
jgi:hypothetical protein